MNPARRAPVGQTPVRRTPVRLAWAAAAVAVLALAGCGQVDAALSKQWAVVNFKPDTTVSTLLQVRETCSHVPNVQPVTVSSVPAHLAVNFSLRYQTSKATGRNLAALQTCLEQFPAVSGVSFKQVTGKIST